MEDMVLVQRYLGGDVDALSALVERHRKPLFGYLNNMLGRNDEAEEVFQETWFRALRKLRDYREDNFPGWLMRIARNLVIDGSRRRKPQVSLDAEPDGGRPLADTLPAGGDDPALAAADGDLGARIRQAVAELPAEQREVFLMRTKANLTFKQIAVAQGVSINTALARMQYALDKLRRALRGEYLLVVGRG